MFIVSNLCAILSNTFARVWIADPSLKVPYLYLESSFAAVRDITFNLAHWIFAIKYWLIALEMQYLIAGRQLSKNLILVIKITNWTFVGLDLVMPLVYSACFDVLNLKYENQLTEEAVAPPQILVTLYLVTNYSKGSLLAASSFFLFDAIRRIRDSLSKVDMA